MTRYINKQINKKIFSAHVIPLTDSIFSKPLISFKESHLLIDSRSYATAGNVKVLSLRQLFL